MMRNEPRYFEPVKIGLSSIETGRERFANPDDLNFPVDVPSRSRWRNNLTALSQHYNLYFCATRETIAVYIPKSPFQNLGRISMLQIVPTPVEPRAKGYIDERTPHTINHLTVGDLGNQEILLVCTDSGGVYAYHTKAIRDTIKEHQYKLNAGERSDYLGLRPFFNQWVHESAWGLSIHKEARMIAVSANKPLRVRTPDSAAKITVFAFALLPDGKELTKEDENDEEEMGDDDCESGWSVWHWLQQEDERPDRTQNWKIVLGGPEGHDENIPSISFVNSCEDPDGDWLLSTDICGEMKIWRIWRGKCWREWDFTQLQLRPGMWHDRRARYDLGWLVAALDPRAFRITETMDEFSGWSRVPRYHGNDTGQSYDITNVVRLHVPGNSPFHPEAAQFEQSEAEGEDLAAQDQMFDLIDEEPIEGGPERDLKIGGAGQNQISGEGASTSRGGIPVEQQDGRPAREVGANASPPESLNSFSLRNGGEMDLDSEGNNNDVDDESHSDESFTTVHRRESRAAWGREVNAQEAADERRMLFSEDVDWGSPERESDERRDEYMSQSGGRKARLGTYLGPGGVLLKLPFIPTIHCSALHVRLLVTPTARKAHYFCARILQQLLPPELAQDPFARLDRLNMFQQIPELGIIIIATQIGRCAICTLTRRGREGRLGFRVDWVLPDRRQERLGQRPLEELLGIAVGPIQSHLPAEPAEPVSGFDNDELWAEDRLIDGTPTTFDQEVVVSGSHRGKQTKSTEGGTSVGLDRYWKQPQRKTRIEKRPWIKPKMPEAWHGTDGGRRYRLMLTYYDQTVLTYEIGRDTPNMCTGPIRRPRRKKQATT